MTQELTHRSIWFHANYLALNSNKSCIIIFTDPKVIIPDHLNIEILIKSFPFKRVPHVKYLGIILDEPLVGHKRVDLVRSKLAKMIGIIHKLKLDVLPANTVRAL